MRDIIFVRLDLISYCTELDSRLQDSSTSQSRVKEAHSALQAKIKSLESQLQRLEAEKESLKVDASFADRNAAFRGHVAGGEREKDTISGLERLVADLRQENIKLIEASRNVSKYLLCVQLMPDFAALLIHRIPLPLLHLLQCASSGPQKSANVVVDRCHSTETPGFSSSKTKWRP